MKLLTPAEIRDTKAQNQAREALRSKELNDAADKARKKLANAEADFQQMMAGQQYRWAQEEQEHTEYVAKAEKEIALLEARREKALEPINLLKERSKKALQEAQIALRSAQRREDEAQALQELLEGKLDAVGAREIDVLQREQKSLVRQQLIEQHERIMEDNRASLNQSFRELTDQRNAIQSEISKQRTDIELLHRTLEAKTEAQKITYNELSEWATRLKDERAILDREYSRQNIRNKTEPKKS